MRRILLGTVTAFAAVMLVPAQAWADAVVTFESPEPGAVVEKPVELALRIDRRLIDRQPETVTLQLSRDGVAPHERSATVALDCVENCEQNASGTTSRWVGPDLHPRTLAPFGQLPACNGRWWLLASADPGPTVRSDETQGAFLVSLPPSTVRDLDASVQGDEVVIGWKAAPENDVVAYRVERRVAGAETWQVLATLGPDARAFTDGPGEGRFDYRVVSIRPDGHVDGQPVPACTDEGHDLTTPSQVWSVRFAATGGTAAPADETAEGGTGSDPEDAGSPSPEGSGTAEGSTSGTSTTGSPRDRIASSRSASGPITAPNLDRRDGAEPRQRYFGEGGPFADRLDYGDVAALADEGDPYAVEQVPGGVVEIFDRELDLEHALRPVAAGMVLVGFGLHLRRWVRETG